MVSRDAMRAAHRRASRQGERKARQRLAKKNGTQTDPARKPRVISGCKNPIGNKGIINTEARFRNRKRPPGWLAPTARQLVQTHLNMVKKIYSVLPMTDWTLEINRFVFMKMEDGSVHGVDFQNGRMKGYKDAHEYVCAVQDGRKKKYGALSVLNQTIPYIYEGLVEMFGEAHVHMCAMAGRQTRNISKTQGNDTACIAALGAEIANIIRTEQFYEVKQFRRHDRANINNQRQRTYKLNGKTVGKNRRKGFAQKEPSVKEFAKSLPPEDRQKILSQIKVTPSRRRYNRKNRMLPGNVFWFAGRRYVMSGQLSGGAFLRAEEERTKTSGFEMPHCEEWRTGNS